MYNCYKFHTSLHFLSAALNLFMLHKYWVPDNFTKTISLPWNNVLLPFRRRLIVQWKTHKTICAFKSYNEKIYKTKLFLLEKEKWAELARLDYKYCREWFKKKCTNFASVLIFFLGKKKYIFFLHSLEFRIASISIFN